MYWTTYKVWFEDGDTIQIYISHKELKNSRNVCQHSPALTYQMCPRKLAITLNPQIE